VQRYADFGPEGLVEPRTETGIEGLMRRALLEWGVEFVQSRQLQGTTHRPDFYLPSYNLAIECDGLYWHSDHVVDKKYHLRRQEDFAAVGVSSLFFREDELLSSFDVVKSIVRNRLGLCSRKIGARKCRVTQDVPVSFFKDNHLMGAGAGRTYGLEYKGEVVAAVQVSWYRKHARVLDISRFCTAKDTSVAGGFSKLLASLILAEQPSLVRSFVDQRYGTGAHLASLGFTPGKKHLSFRWAKGRKTLHRLVFPSNSGYTNGWCKLWDCGQVLWTKEL
jgi:very-short-patch-repair endonuclease